MTARENELAEKLEARALGLARGLTSAPGESTGDLLRLAASTLRANAERIKALEAALAKIDDGLLCGPHENTHYCPNCARSLYDVWEIARAARSNPNV